jgi:hypothetical protein
LLGSKLKQLNVCIVRRHIESIDRKTLIRGLWFRTILIEVEYLPWLQVNVDFTLVLLDLL